MMESPVIKNRTLYGGVKGKLTLRSVGEVLD
jgi:hypothetical protein